MTNEPSVFIKSPAEVNEYLSQHGLHPKLADVKFRMRNEGIDVGVHTFDVKDHHGFLCHCELKHSTVIMLYRKDVLAWKDAVTLVNSLFESALGVKAEFTLGGLDRNN